MHFALIDLIYKLYFLIAAIIIVLGPDRASFPEARLSARDVREETHQPEKTGSQTDQTSPTSGSETRSEISTVFSQ